MRIGFVLDDTLDSSDGVQQYIVTLGQWLTHQKHEVHYLVGQTAREDLPHIHSLSRNIKVHFNRNRMTIPLSASGRHITEILNQSQLDVIHIQMPYSPMLGEKVIRKAKKSTPDTVLVGTFHILPFGMVQRLGARLLFLLQKGSLRRLQRVLSVSQPAQVFARQLGVDSVVLPNVVDTQRFSKGRKPKRYKDSFTVVFLGRLVERKGCAELLQAVQQIVKQDSVPNLKVLICGAGPQLASLQTWVNDHELASYVEFMGFVDEDEKVNYLHSADLAIFPSLGGESFGIVLIEAMAAGAGVVLGGNNAGYASVLHEVPGSLIDPHNTTATANYITELFQNESQRQKLHNEQQKLVKKYDVAVVGKKLVSYYKEVQAQ